MTHILVDGFNIFHRAKYVVRGDPDDRGALALHIIFTSIKSVWDKHAGSHVVLALEGGKTWRRPIFEGYKAQRRLVALQKTEADKEEDEIFFGYMNELVKFCQLKTNITVLQVPNCEADDVIARWIVRHPDEKHIILSTDTDFFQLISDNVSLYNGIEKVLITNRGFFDDYGRPIIEKRNSLPKKTVEPEWELFKKCMKGDVSDNIFRASEPRTRETKLREAYEDRVDRGYLWNNIMLASWTDHEGVTARVIDRFARNVMLIDLAAQPQEIKDKIDLAIEQQRDKEPKTQVGWSFLKFCKDFNLKRLGENADKYAAILNLGVRK